MTSKAGLHLLTKREPAQLTIVYDFWFSSELQVRDRKLNLASETHAEVSYHHMTVDCTEQL